MSQSGSLMSRTNRKKIILLVEILLISILLSWSYSVYSSSLTPPPLKGTFLQIYRQHDNWPAEKWDQLFRYLKKLEIKEVVIQWVVYDDANFIQQENNGHTLDRVINLAASAGIKVRLGLVYDSQFWTKIQREPPLVEVYLRRLLLQSKATAGLLAQRYPNITNYYIATEVDDKNWQDSASRLILFNYLKELTSYLHGLVPGSGVAISGFSNALVDPGTLENFWIDLLKTSDIDTVFFQDGIGTKKMQISSLPLYLKAIERAVRHQGRRLGIVIELFQQIKSEPFQASPASLKSIQQQIAIAEQYAPANLLGFSIPEYMSPLGGESAANLYQQYLKTYSDEKCKVRQTN